MTNNTANNSSAIQDMGAVAPVANGKVKPHHWLNVQIGKGLFGIPLDGVDKDGHRLLKGATQVVADQIMYHYRDKPCNQMVDVTICGRSYKYYHIDDSTPKEIDTELTFD